MQISFGNTELEELCLVGRRATKVLGKAGAKKLRARLEDLASAQSVSELIAGRPHPLTGDRLGQFALNLDGGRRLVFEPSRDPPPVREDNSIDWSKVDDIRIVYIGDYHD